MLTIDALQLPAAPVSASLANGRLLSASAAGDVWFDGNRIQNLPRPRSVALSPSAGQALLIREQDRGVTTWAPSGSTYDIAGSCVDAAFVLRGNEELIAVASKHEVTLHRPSGEFVATQPLGGLAAASLHSVAAGRALAVLGAEFGESRDTLVLFSAAEIPVAAPIIGRRFRFTEGLVDSAHVLAVGPAGLEHVVVFRDGEDEESLTADDQNAIVPREWGLRGFYIATQLGQTTDRISWGGSIAPGSRVTASERFIAVGAGASIDVISRQDGTSDRLDLRWLSNTYAGERVLATDQDGQLRVLHL